MAARYTHKSVADVEDAAEKFGFGETHESRFDATTGQAIVAFVTLKGGADGSVEKLEELRAHVATKSSRLRTEVLTDAFAILLFATIGQLSHHGHVSATGYAEDALPFLVCWFAAYAVFHGRFVPTWLVGVTLGVALRAVILSHYRWNELAFWLVSLAFVGAVSLALRQITNLVRQRRTRFAG